MTPCNGSPVDDVIFPETFTEAVCAVIETWIIRIKIKLKQSFKLHENLRGMERMTPELFFLYCSVYIFKKIEAGDIRN